MHYIERISKQHLMLRYIDPIELKKDRSELFRIEQFVFDFKYATGENITREVRDIA